MEARLVEFWDEMAPQYDRGAAPFEKTVMRPVRIWACAKARGDILVIASGTGVDLDHIPAGLPVTCLDGSPRMLDETRNHARDIGREIEMVRADAMSMPFGDASFDTVLCTFGLCSIDPDGALPEVARVLRPGGSLLLADHIVSTFPPLRWGQRLLERASVPKFDEHFTRRPLDHVRRRPEFEVLETTRRSLGAIEGVHAQRR